MKTVLASLAAVAALAAVATPAAAQGYYYRHDGGMTYDTLRKVDSRQAAIARQIDIGVRRGDLTPNEAYRLQHELRGTEMLEARYREGGIKWWERNELNRRLGELEARTRYERRDDDHRWGGYGRW